MDWILDNSQIVIFVAVAILYWLKEFIEKKMAQRQEQVPHPDVSIEADYGEPEPWASVPPPLPATGDGTPAGDAARARGKRKVAPRERRLRQPKAITKATTTGGAAATSAALAAKGTEKPAATTSVSLRQRLRLPGEIRSGIVLREILGPPVGLR